MAGRSGRVLDRISIYTNKKSFSYGGNGGAAFNVSILPSGFQVLVFFGKSGSLIDQIGFYIHTL
ncbi:jacalin-like lectin [Aquimarina sp. RZ0]|uniref:jacalin-like lectin n=1 Tax=Aquimarina sp. RZ0 TaxID=2607730 RepID=UPI0034CEBAB9